MTDSDTRQLVLIDPLTDVTRRVRRVLLASGAIGVVIVKTGLVPSKISNLGITFTTADKSSLLIIVASIIIYFFIEFLLYAGSDFIRWQIALRTSLLKNKGRNARKALQPGPHNPNQSLELRQAAASARLEEILEKKLNQYLRPYSQMTPFIGILRAFLDFGFPILLGIYSVYLLVMVVICEGF